MTLIKQIIQLIQLGNTRQFRLTLIPVLILELLSIFLLFKLNGIYGNLYSAIQEYRPSDIWRSIGYFTGLALILVFVNGYLGYYINRLSFVLRDGITQTILKHIESGKYTGQKYLGQRIQEDVGKFATTVCDLSSAILRAGLKLPLFLYVIVSLTQWYVGLIILVTTILGTYITRVVAGRLVPLQADQETNEARFRNDLTSLNFTAIRTQFGLINSKLKLLSFTQSGLQQVFVLLPFILLLPLYISKTITMGPFFQSVNALGKIIESLLVIIDNRQLIVTLEATLLRLKFLSSSSPTVPGAKSKLDNNSNSSYNDSVLLAGFLVGRPFDLSQSHETNTNETETTDSKTTDTKE